MSQTTNTGIDFSTAQSIAEAAASRVRNELQREINALERELRSEIQRLEREMREVGEMIVSELRDQTSQISNRIENQTVAVVGGVAANTLMLERTKSQIQDDFDKTRTKIDLQTEASLQIEVGKKMADSLSTHAKLMAFARDIKNRFEKSLEFVYLNRQLYNVNFQKIVDEYTNKLKTIGEHIFLIRDSDISPAIEAAHAPLDQIHGLPMEVDLYRLKVRSENLEEVLNILKESRFDKVVNSINSLETTLETQYALNKNITNSSQSKQLSVVGLATISPIATDILVGAKALEVEKGQLVNIENSSSYNSYQSNKVESLIMNVVSSSEATELTIDEIKDLIEAAKRLVDKKMISNESLSMFEDFLGSGNLKFVR
jgi:hypothetical protein